MNSRKPAPGVSREQGISDSGLERLEKQLASGVNISATVLSQWVRRYGDSAREVIEKYQRKKPGLK